MVRHWQPLGGYASTLNGAVTVGATSWTVTSATGLPAEGDFYLFCEEELVKVTSRSGAVLTVERGQNGTTAVGHGNGSDVLSVIASTDWTNRINETAQWGRGANNKNAYGRLYDDGNLLTASDFTLVNGGNSISDGANGCVVLKTKQHSGHDVTGAHYDFGSADFRLTAHLAAPYFETSLNSVPGDFWGLYMRQNTGGAMRGIVYGRSGGTNSQRRIEVHERTTFLASPTIVFNCAYMARRDFWFRIERRTNDWDFFASPDGVTFVLVHTIVNWIAGAVSTGFWANFDQIDDNQLQCLSWYREVS